MNGPAAVSPIDLVQAQFDAYNAQDLDGLLASFADDMVVADLNGAVTVQGKEAFRAKHVQLFADFPQNKAELQSRVAIGNVVIDHEQVARSPEGPFFEVAAIYTIAGGKIARIDFVK